MKFAKLNGAGNDFIVLDNRKRALPEDCFPALARKLCHRRLSLGADGLMAVLPSEKADFRMDFYNSDGSVGEMCGNGARCICRWACEQGLCGESQTVETASGFVYGWRIDRRNYKIRLPGPTAVRTDYPLEIGGRQLECAYVELGDPGLPHAVVHLPGLREFDETALFDLGRRIRWHEGFLKGANVNFYEFTGENQIYERTFERGVEGFTYACGTGTASVGLILTLKGLSEGKAIQVDVPGGRLAVDVEQNGTEKALYLTGPTNLVAEGELLDEDIDWAAIAQ